MVFLLMPIPDSIQKTSDRLAWIMEFLQMWLSTLEMETMRVMIIYWMTSYIRKSMPLKEPMHGWTVQVAIKQIRYCRFQLREFQLHNFYRYFIKENLQKTKI
jgi:hypothetical protein